MIKKMLKDIFDCVFIRCDFQTQLQIKKVSQLTYRTYQIKFAEPINQKITCKILHDGNELKNFNLKKNCRREKIIQIVGIYKRIANDKSKFKIMYDGSDKTLIFELLFLNDTKSETYTCKTLGNNISIICDGDTYAYPRCLKYYSDRKRFQYYHDGKFHGSYRAEFPRQAAKKICTYMYRKKLYTQSDTELVFDFAIREIISRRIYHYHYFTGKIIIRTHPITINNYQCRLTNKVYVREPKFGTIINNY